MSERPLRFLRVKGRLLQTPVLLYRHPGTGREVTLIGMSHIGTASYFADLAAEASRLERGGAAVLYEMIESAPDDEWAAATDAERAARDAFNGELHKFVAPQLMRYLGWTWQGDAMEYGPGWVCADMTDLEFIRSAGPEAVLADSSSTGRVQQLLIDALGSHAAASFAALFSALFWAAGRSAAVAARITSGLAAPGSPGSQVKSALVGARNEHALRVLGQQPGDAVLLWGADHLTGIADALSRDGFRRVHARWASAGAVLPLWRAAQGLARLCVAVCRIAPTI